MDNAIAHGWHNKRDAAMKTMKSAGFSLIEVMIVVAIIGIIAAYAYPSYQEQISKGQRTEGQTFLLDAMARQERFYSENNTYTNNLGPPGLGYNDPDGDGDIETERGYFLVSAEQCGVEVLTVCVNITATAQGPLDDGENTNDLTLNSRNVKTPADFW